MRMATTLFVFLAACTSSDATSKAVDVLYDSDGSGLMSSNVQDALDDLLAMARASEDKLDQMEKGNAIVCKFETANLTIPAYAAMPHVFTALECGGTLPDERYVGAISKLETCSIYLSGTAVMSAGEPDGPGIVLRHQNSACSSPAKLVVVFHRVK